MTPRVLHAVEQFLPRSETFVYTIVCGHRRFEASVVCHSRAHAAEFPFPRVAVLPNAQSLRTAAGLVARSVQRVTGRSPWARAIEAILAAERPSVVHAHFGPVGCELVELTRAAGIPLVTSLYGVDAAVLPYTEQWRDRYVRLFRDGTLFLAEGPQMRQKIIAAGAPADRTLVNPISLNLSKYPKWAPDGSSTVLFASRFVEKKGLVDAIAAFALALARVPGAGMTIVGAGPDEDDARALIARLGVGSRITFVGMQPHAEVIRLLTSAAVFIHPSVTAADGDSEGGAPTILLEAQAIGTPIVSTRHADIPNIVAEGPGAILCEEHDVTALGEALIATLQRGTASSAAIVLERHDVAVVAPRLEAIYDQVIAGAAAASPAR